MSTITELSYKEVSKDGGIFSKEMKTLDQMISHLEPSNCCLNCRKVMYKRDGHYCPIYDLKVDWRFTCKEFKFNKRYNNGN